MQYYKLFHWHQLGGASVLGNNDVSTLKHRTF